MKKIVSGEELKQKMIEAIELLCGTVKETLGPYGSNVIIDHSTFSPFITNDGVTIASNIESDDEVINTILSLAKESSVKTNDRVGDGTTTTLVLLEALFKRGIEIVNEGYSPIILKSELNVALASVVNELLSLSRKPNKNDLFNIAKISGGANELAENVTSAYLKTGSKSAIHIKETDALVTRVEELNGYTFDTILPSVYFFQNGKNVEYDDIAVIIINRFLNDIDEIAPLINDCMNNSKPLIVIAEDYSDEITNNVLSLYLENNIKICLLKIPEYGLKKKNVLKDLESIIDSSIIEGDIHGSCNLGFAKGIIINPENTTIRFINNENVKNRISHIEQVLLYESDELEKEFFYEKLAMLKKGSVNIFVGAPTDTERKELRMRYDDALCAISCADKGVVLGCGVPYLKVASNLSGISKGEEILKEALQRPFLQVLMNAGINTKDVEEKIKSSDYKNVYNVKTQMYEDEGVISVIDPVEIVINSLTNAVSIASLLLTTSTLVINEYMNNVNKINNYTEM